MLILNENKTIDSIFDGYDEWLLIGSDPPRTDVDTEPKDHPLTVCAD